MNIQFGSGSNILEGWLNLQESNGDITKPLPFKNDSVDHVFTEHCVEHTTPLQGFRFFKECHRILKPNGVLRVIVPDVKNIWDKCDDNYLGFIDESMDQWWQHAGQSPPRHPCTPQTAFETILVCHGHQAAYTPDLLLTFLKASGFRASIGHYGTSQHPELNEVDGHWKMMGRERCVMESVVAEGVK
jgi:predicted SAM-dependent methyltransferase